MSRQFETKSLTFRQNSEFSDNRDPHIIITENYRKDKKTDR
jgi:hypothetical protein